MSKSFTFKVFEIRELSEDISQVFLTPKSDRFHYEAGQYIFFLMPDEEPRPYSIANAPQNSHLEFHIRHQKNNPYAQKLMQQFRNDKQAKLSGPFGNMRYMSNPKLPLLFVATGTGFAPCKALIEEALRNENPPEMALFWGARELKDLYFHQELQDLQQKHPNFSYTPVLGERVYDAVLKQYPDLAHFHIYACGHEQMVLTAQKLFNNPPHFYSDWLDFVAKN